jgi:hypothetical protein
MNFGGLEIMARQAREEIPRRRLRLRMPYLAHDIFCASLDKLRCRVGSRYWTLPDTKFPDEVKHFRKRKDTLGLKRQSPMLRKGLPRRTTDVLSTRIDSALKLLEQAEREGPINRPIDVYYSCSTLCEVYSRIFFTWGANERKGHGISCRHQDDRRRVGQSTVNVQPNGTFPRLETTLFLLWGWPSCFSDLVTYSSRPTAHTGPGEYLEKFCAQEVGTPLTQQTLEDLYGFDYTAQVRALRLRHGFHKFNGLTPTAFLLDYMVLFVASSLARYDAAGWHEVLAGRSNPYRKLFEETFERYRDFTADALLSAIEEPSFTMRDSLIPSVASPYCHSHRRFGGNPNAD